MNSFVHVSVSKCPVCEVFRDKGGKYLGNAWGIGERSADRGYRCKICFVNHNNRLNAYNDINSGFEEFCRNYELCRTVWDPLSSIYVHGLPPSVTITVRGWDRWQCVSCARVGVLTVNPVSADFCTGCLREFRPRMFDGGWHVVNLSNWDRARNYDRLLHWVCRNVCGTLNTPAQENCRQCNAARNYEDPAVDNALPNPS